MAKRSATRRRRLSWMGAAFNATLGVYLFFLVGIIAANLVIVAGTSDGRRQFIESFWGAYTVSDRSVRAMKLDGLPADVAAKLQPMTGRPFASRSKFEAELAAHLPPADLAIHGDTILKHAFAHNTEVWHAVWVSLWTSTIAAVISLLISVPAGYVLSRRHSKSMRLLDALVDIPIVLPPLLFGISLLVLFQKSRMLFELSECHAAREYIAPAVKAFVSTFVHRPAGIVLVQVLIAAAYGTRMLKGTFDAFDPRLPAVAQTLGCTPARAFFTVTLPTVRGSVVAALVMVWARALALYGPIIAFVGATTNYNEVMPTRMFLEMSTGRLEAALAVSLMMILLAGLVLLVLKLAGGGRDEMARMTRM